MRQKLCSLAWFTSPEGELRNREMEDQVVQEDRVVLVVPGGPEVRQTLVVLVLQRLLVVLGGQDGQQFHRWEMEQAVEGQKQQGWEDQEGRVVDYHNRLLCTWEHKPEYNWLRKGRQRASLRRKKKSRWGSVGLKSTVCCYRKMVKIAFHVCITGSFLK